ncbi:MAG: AAA family ATPase [Acidimicrobiales bacterium]
MACPSCGVIAPPGARFCGSCGAPLERRTDERRLVSVLFADLVGYTTLAESRDPETVKNLVDSCFERLVADVVAFGGVVDKIIGDAIVALFGAPIAHEDDPERAVRAALRMQETLAHEAHRFGLELRMRVGVNTGEVLVGTLRAGGDYTAMGDVVNTASRLQVLALPGQVLVGPATHAATAGSFRYESLGLLRAKGRDEPVPAWVAHEAIGLPGFRPRTLRAPLVGRDEEMGLLRHSLATATSRKRASVVLLLGEAGVGKSRLADELIALARSEGAYVLEGRCVPYGEVNVWAPLVEALRRAAGISAEDDLLTAPRPSRSAVAAILGMAEDAPEVERVLSGIGPLMGKSGKPSGSSSMSRARPDSPDGGDAQGDEEALFGVATCLERMCAQRPLVFVIGELHWADDVLLDFLSQLMERVAEQPLMLVATARPQLLDRWRPPVGRHNRLVLHVDPLDAAASAALLCHLAGPDLSTEHRDLLVARSGGNPLWLEELSALAGPMETVPATLVGLVAARLDGLGAEAREVVEDAAVCGRAGEVAAVAAMADAAGRPGVDAALDALAEAGLITLIHGRESWELRSDLVREVAYGRLTMAERAHRHARLAGWLEARSGPDPSDDVLDELAHHWAAAAGLVAELGEVEADRIPADAVSQAVHWVGLAARRAGEQERWLPASGLLDTALGLAKGSAAEPEFLLERARARVGMHDAAGASADLAALGQLPHADGTRMAALVVAGDLARIQSNLGEAEKLLVAALELARELGDESAELSALRSLAQTRLFAGDNDGATEAATEGLEAARRAGDRRGEAWALQHLAWASFSAGDFETAKTRLHESVAAFAEIGDWGGHGWAEGLLAWVTFACGELQEAEVLGARVLSEAERTGDVWAISMMRTLIANVRLWSGLPEEAAAAAEAAAEGMASMDDVWGEVQARLVLGRARLAMGELADGRAELEAAVVTAQRLEEGGMNQAASAVLCISLALQLGEGVAALASIPRTDGVGGIASEELLAAEAVAQLQCGRVDEAARVIAPLLGWEATPPPSLPASAAPWVALVLIAAGRRNEADAVLDRVPATPPGTFLDEAWSAVARLALAREPAERVRAATRARQIVDATGDQLARTNVLRAVAILDPALGVDPQVDMGDWRRMWETVRAG